ncbi:OsmC family protein [Myroides marinus]|uniref:Osmotically inducible protein OsmC n=1 Tax=Myroides marinus TaxID=703342 RepID=A0A164AIS7_9FLAO|nr:OsmC family protein [Myroides marinus]KZE83935.1 osmotically inducible protein OsmC [Myroides marinus]MDM1350667.1 OsmC family protein [Myroides marinus]MDM1357874.1 OsmC family protein [Myroides marinus]MDM1366197.1 OsmC family protein [Myroides marinus]MDM1370621.1 OsmC family protein [Myroides marinus]
MYKHLFKAALNWMATDKLEESNKKVYAKSHTIKIEGKDILSISAAKAFKGDPTLLNPEDLLLSALTSCHMMSYLYVCQQNNIEVLTYEDNSEATLILNDDGSGHITKVVLNPVVRIKDASQKELALQLHIQANKLCFIANSCNFEIEHHAQCYS